MVNHLQDYVAAEQRRVDEVRAALDALNRTVTLQPTMTEQEHTAAAAHAVATRLSELATRLSTDLLESRVRACQNHILSQAAMMYIAGRL